MVLSRQFSGTAVPAVSVIHHHAWGTVYSSRRAMLNYVFENNLWMSFIRYISYARFIRTVMSSVYASKRLISNLSNRLFLKIRLRKIRINTIFYSKRRKIFVKIIYHLSIRCNNYSYENQSIYHYSIESINWLRNSIWKLASSKFSLFKFFESEYCDVWYEYNKRVTAVLWRRHLLYS